MDQAEALARTARAGTLCRDRSFLRGKGDSAYFP
jgi:hypothetical protein